MDRHDMAAGRSERRVHHGWNSDIQVGLRRKITVFCCIESAFEIIDIRPDVNASCQIFVAAPQRRECRQSRQREIYLRDGSYRSISSHLRQESRIEMRWVYQLQKSLVRIDI